MYINPVVVGILGTLLTEVLIIVFGSLLACLDSKGENKNGKNNNNQSNQ